jgi:hypothetical protein
MFAQALECSGGDGKKILQKNAVVVKKYKLLLPISIH